MTYKILNNITCLDPNMYFQTNCSHTRAGVSNKLYTPLARHDVRRFFFSYRIVHIYNSAFVTITNLSINAFKNFVKNFVQSNIVSDFSFPNSIQC